MNFFEQLVFIHKNCADFLCIMQNKPRVYIKERKFPIKGRGGKAHFALQETEYIFSAKIPYPLVGSLTKTWVTAPTSFPS